MLKILKMLGIETVRQILDFVRLTEFLVEDNCASISTTSTAITTPRSKRRLKDIENIQ